jgi:hypothetical protein
MDEPTEQAQQTGFSAPPWEDVAEQFRQAFPQASEDYMRERYGQVRQMAQTRATYQNQEVPAATNIVRESVPFMSTVVNTMLESGYARAKKRLEEGRPEENDYHIIAQHEHVQQQDAARNAGVLGRLGQGVRQLPALIGEYVATGGVAAGTSALAGSAIGQGVISRGIGLAAQGAVMPSLWGHQSVQNNLEAGRDAVDWRGFPAAMATGAIQNVILGSLGKLTGAFIPGETAAAAIGRIGGAGPAYVLEQQAADAITGVLNLKSGYGLLGELAKGKDGKPMEELIGQLLTGWVFGGLHELQRQPAEVQAGEQALGGLNEPVGPEGPQAPPGEAPQAPRNAADHPVMKAAVDVMNGFQREGMSLRAATNAINAFVNEFQAMMRNPNMTREQIRDFYKNTKNAGLRRFGEALADYMPERQAPEPPPQPQAGPESPQNAPGQAPPQDGPQAIAGQNQPGAATPETPAPETTRQTVDRLTNSHLEAVRALNEVEATAKREQAFGTGKISDATMKASAEARKTVKGIERTLGQARDRLFLEGEPPVTPTIVDHPGAVAEHIASFPDVTPEIVEEAKTLAKEIPDAIAKLSASTGLSEASIRRDINSALSQELANAQAPLTNAGNARPAEGGGPVAPAPTERGAPRGDQLTQDFFGVKPEQRTLIQAAEESTGKFVGDMPRPAAEPLYKPLPPKKTLLSIIKKAGGLSKESAKNHGWDVDAMEEGLPSIFKDHKGRKGSLDPAQAAEHLINEGHMIADKADPMLHERLAEAIVVHAQTLERDMERELARDQARYHQENLNALQEPIRAGHNPKLAQEALQAGIEDGARQGVESGASQAGTEPPEEAHQELVQPPETGEGPTGQGAESGHPTGGDVGTFDPAEFGLPPGTGAGRIVRGLHRSGQLTLPDVGADAQKVVQKIGDFVGRLSGKMFPATTRLSGPAGEALARFAVSKTYAREATDYYVDRIMGDKPWPWEREKLAKYEADALLVGAVLTERRLRYMKHAFAAAGDFKSAALVNTIIGKPGSPLQSLADYRAALNGPVFDAAIRRWNNELVPLLDETFKQAQGMNPNDPIDSMTQIPGSPMNLKPMQAGEEVHKGAVFTGGGSEFLRNPRARKLKFSRQATGQAEAYDIDIRNIIENSLTHAIPLAAKAEMYRTMEKEGLMKWGQEGQGLMFGEERGKEFPNVKPPAGTQAAAKGQTSAYFDPAVAGEVRDSLKEETPAYQQTLHAISTIPTIASLASSVEAVTHALNLGGALYAPNMIRNVFSAAYDAIRSSPQFRQEVLALAKIGAMKAPGLESGTIVGPIRTVGKYLTGKELPEGAKYLDPTFYAGKFLDGMSKVVRVTAARAFDELVAKNPNIPKTETNKRDFINQLTGQYEKKAQAGIIQWVRNTGIGPFATAGTTMTSRAVRTVIGGATGLSSSDWLTSLQMRSRTYAKLAAILGSVAAFNFLRWGRADGDDKTPWGAIKLGQDRNGKTIYLDTPASIPRRGLRAIGALSIIEGNRRQQPAGTIADRAGHDIVNTLAHPLLGPTYQTAHTALTGENAVGIRVAPRAMPGQSQLLLYAGTAAGGMNPVVSAMLGFDRKPGEISEWYEKAARLLGPFGPKFR